MIVLDDICEICNYTCKTIYFRQNFENWTSGNNKIDKFIQNSQLSAHDFHKSDVLEWIPYDKFCNIKDNSKNKFGNIYSANWIDGYILDWDSKSQNWKREGQNMFVILKSLNNPVNISLEFINKV